MLSNTGGRQITKKTHDFWESGSLRESLQYSDFEDLISKGAFNEEGGLKHSSIIDKSLIDVYVPFLPLESGHVRQCIAKEIRDRGQDPNVQVGMITKILETLSFWPEDARLYATAGCKRVSQRVDELLYEAEMGLSMA